jgi:hypothetical protein
MSMRQSGQVAAERGRLHFTDFLNGRITGRAYALHIGARSRVPPPPEMRVMRPGPLAGPLSLHGPFRRKKKPRLVWDHSGALRERSRDGGGTSRKKLRSPRNGVCVLAHKARGVSYAPSAWGQYVEAGMGK